MDRRPTLRASDSDRERIAERLRHATAEGRLLVDELEERLGAVFSARTYGELDHLVADLPAAPSRPRDRAVAPGLVRGSLALAALAAALAVVAAASYARFGMEMGRAALSGRTQQILAHSHRSFAALQAAPAVAGVFAIFALCATLAWLYYHAPLAPPPSRGSRPANR